MLRLGWRVSPAKNTQERRHPLLEGCHSLGETGVGTKSRYGLTESGIQETRSSESGLGANEGTGEDRTLGVCL